jgi:peroxiredoxin
MRNHSRNYLSLILILLISNLISAQSNYFELNGAIYGQSVSGKVFITYSDANNIKIIDSVNIINNKFILKGSITSPTKAYISNNNQFRLDKISSEQIYLEPKKMNVSFNLYDFRALRLDSSKTQNEYLHLKESKFLNSSKLDSIYNLKSKLYNNINIEKDSLIKSDLQKKIYNVEKLIEKYNINDIQLEFDFIKQNPSSFVTLDLLSFRLRRREGIQYYETISKLLVNLAINVQSSGNGMLLKKALINFKQSGIGNTTPYFIAKDINNESISIADFKNQKYILIDFWASWCAPCRNDFSFLQEIYSKYNKKGFDIISISTDKDSELWKNAIIKDNIQMWKHISIKENSNTNLSGVTFPIEDIYFVTSIPVKVLINKEGIIIGRWRGGGNENKDEIAKLLFEIFEK